MPASFGTLVPADLEIFFTGLDASYSNIYASTPSWATQLATIRPSSSMFERYGWMDRVPTLREWIGPRIKHGVQTESLFVENKLFELTMAVEKYRILADEWGIFSNLAAQMGWQSAKWMDQQIAAAILGNIKGTDGVAFFSTAHPIDLYKSATLNYSNLHASKPLTADNVAFGIATMASQVAQDGQPLNVSPNLLVCPPNLKHTAMTILNASFIAPATLGNGASQVGSNDNVLKGALDLLVLPEIAENVSQTINQTSYPGDDDDWYLVDTRMPVKPITFQLFQAPTLVARVNPQDPHVFEMHEFLYGVEAFGAPVLTFPFLMHKFLNGSS